MTEVYVVMEYPCTNYPEDDENKIRSVFSDCLTANQECDRLEESEGSPFVSFGVAGPWEVQ